MIQRPLPSPPLSDRKVFAPGGGSGGEDQEDVFLPLPQVTCHPSISLPSSFFLLKKERYLSKTLAVLQRERGRKILMEGKQGASPVQLFRTQESIPTLPYFFSPIRKHHVQLTVQGFFSIRISSLFSALRATKVQMEKEERKVSLSKKFALCSLLCSSSDACLSFPFARH